MLRPRVDKADCGEENQGDSFEVLAEKMRILVESPLFFTSDLFTQDLVSQNARLLQIIHR